MHQDIFYGDEDPVETQEWLQAFHSLVKQGGAERAKSILEKLNAEARQAKINADDLTTPYLNTIAVPEQAPFPGDMYLERRIRSLIRWNALVMVLRANKDNQDELGGHIATFASAATLYDVGFNHFFKADSKDSAGDLVLFQGHSSPGIYARAFLEGRIDEARMDHFRREVGGKGLSSYPHPWLMPDFWQFPTVSMGLGPIQAIYQAYFSKFLDNRGLFAQQKARAHLAESNPDRKIWAFLGDGEMDEPESLGAISLAGRESLDNLIFVVNCNLQRLDGPVRGNGKIIQELEGVFRGAGWNVIKVIWGRHWDPLLARDEQGALRKRMQECVDGEYQAYKTHGGAYTREHFFGKYPELAALVEQFSDEDVYKLNRGGHDPIKVFAAYQQACTHKGQPTVILAKTVKGYGLGAGEGLNKTHQLKKMDFESLKGFRDRFDMPFTDEELEKLPYYRPAEDSTEMRYLRERRQALGGYLPRRRQKSQSLKVADLNTLFEQHLLGSGDKMLSTTMGLVRMLSNLLKNSELGERIVPIVPDEARTFGMEGMFRQLGIYSSVGQLYKPEDAGQMMYYREDTKGRILEAGINEAGAYSAWLAAATSYSHHDLPMIPFYIFYSMFGFQRIGDLIWAGGDMQARGFLIGATAGRTTLNGEGLQHQDGHSHLLAATVPNCVAYDPAYNEELAVIVQNGLQRMMAEQENVFYYITTMNENYAHPGLSEEPEQRATQVSGIIKGMYLLQNNLQEISSKQSVHLLGSGTILNEVVAAAEILTAVYQVESQVWSVTSYNELRRQGLSVERDNRLHPDQPAKRSYVSECLDAKSMPVIAASDYMKLVVDQIRPYTQNHFTALGTDGFGRSDARELLRHHFEVDRYFIVLAAIAALAEKGVLGKSKVADVIARFELDVEKPNPMCS